MMTIEKFNNRFSDKGGFTMFSSMVFGFLPHKMIAEHFKISKTSVGTYIRELFRENSPDTIFERRQKRINSILEFMKTHSKEESFKVFKKTHKEYYREALFLAYKEGIYKI